jgi:hypothetical protein
MLQLAAYVVSDLSYKAPLANYTTHASAHQTGQSNQIIFNYLGVYRPFQSAPKL